MDGSRSLYTRDYQQYQHQRTKNSMSVSQSPDSVALASASDNTEQQNNNNHSSEVGLAVAVSGNVNANQFQQQSMQSSSSVSSQQQPRLAKSSNVKNPYLKQAPAETIPLDAKAQERQKFLDKYRLQAIQHNQRRGDRKAGGGSCYSAANTTTTTIGVTPISALELRRTTHQWRQSWRNGNDSCSMDTTTTANINSNGGNNSCRNVMIMPMPIMRPRLFLLHRHERANQQQRQRQTMQQQQQQQQSQSYNNSQQDEMQYEVEKSMQNNNGVWELGTGITELSGEGGSGKTQICLSACATCAMTPLLFPSSANTEDVTAARLNDNNHNAQPFHNQLHQQPQHSSGYTAIYITMGEGIPSPRIAMRLEQMVRARLLKNNNNNNPPNQDDEIATAILSRIGLISIRNEEEFVEFVTQDLPAMLENHNTACCHTRQSTSANRHQHQHQQPTKIGLIAFDGIAGFFRFSDPTYQHTKNSMFHFQRSSKLFTVSSQLRQLSDVYDVPMLITNQVSAAIPPIAAAGGGGGGGSDAAAMFATTPEQVIPALGLIWSNCVSTRYILQRKDGMVARITDENAAGRRGSAGNGQQQQQRAKELRVRKARILQSVNMPVEREVLFVIDTGEVLVVE